MKPLFLFLFVTAATRLLSQTIENVDFRAVGKTIVVSYDLLHPMTDTSINVVLVFIDQQGVSIVPKSISGDIKNVKPGEGKRILWDVLADGIPLSGKYKAKVSIQRTASSVKIGSQVWATENLNVDRFRNGDPIPQAKTDEEWKRAGNNKQPAWCYYDNAPQNGEIYGKLYNWYAVNDRRGLAPQGWHIPTYSDWSQLCYFLGGENIAGKKIKSIEGWKSWININTNGSDEFGFCAYPSGYRYFSGRFEGYSEKGIFWSANEYINGIAYYMYLTNYTGQLGYQNKFSIDYDSNKNGYAVRCIKD